MRENLLRCKTLSKKKLICRKRILGSDHELPDSFFRTYNMTTGDNVLNLLKRLNLTEIQFE